MRATFGTLEDRVLELKPGLNIVEAPNEWGKSTWCAFLAAMLYGIDTRARSTQTALAEKEKYAPWSGSPMEGRIDLNWNGRDITIERRTKGRTPFGVFKAYETDTGMEVPELTGANCGQLLLGVEKSVFTRTAFLRLNDLPVTQDEALRRRLNALVTTGDESGAGDMLGARLKELKNACRYNRSTGLIPKAEAELAALEEKQRELDRLSREAEENKRLQKQTENYLNQLKNHQTALAYQNALADRARVLTAEQAFAEAAARRDRLEAECAQLPRREAAEETRRQVRDLQQQWMGVQAELQDLPPEPQAPEKVDAFEEPDRTALLEKVRRDVELYHILREIQKKKPVLGWFLLILGLIGAGMCAAVELWIAVAVAAVVSAAGVVLLVLSGRKRKGIAEAVEKLVQPYPRREPERWLAEAENYAGRIARYQEQLAQRRAAGEALAQRGESIRERLREIAQGRDLRSVLEELQRVIDAWNELEDAVGDLQQAGKHLDHIRAMAKNARPPEFEDTLKCSEGDTLRLIGEYTARQRQLAERLGRLRGSMNAIGDGKLLQARIDSLRLRIGELEETEEALELAQRTLAAATEQLQRRFAPRITERARILFSRLTDGRYDRLNLTKELAVDAAATGELTMHSAQWRSEGTVDQLYIALRLAVAEELTPAAPLVLDDALARFDDRRLKNALEVLAEAAGSRQVILFTCRKREGELFPQT